MKFATTLDAQTFLVEIGMVHEISSVTDDFKPTDKMMELFIQKRKTLIPGLKNFRKQQATKAQWRKGRFKLLKGIKRFHRSTKGKKMHRAIGRFLATRDFSNGNFKRESYENISIHDVCEILKAISSVRTHNYIEFEYYHPLEEEVQYQTFSEKLISTTFKIEQALISDLEIVSEELDFLSRVCEPRALCIELSQQYKIDVEHVHDMWSTYLSEDEKCEEEWSILASLNQFKDYLYEAEQLQIRETAAQVDAFAKESGKSKDDVEKAFLKAKEIAKEDGRKETDKDFFPLVVGIVKKIIGISKSK